MAKEIKNLRDMLDAKIKGSGKHKYILADQKTFPISTRLRLADTQFLEMLGEHFGLSKSHVARKILSNGIRSMLNSFNLENKFEKNLVNLDSYVRKRGKKEILGFDPDKGRSR